MYRGTPIAPCSITCSGDPSGLPYIIDSYLIDKGLHITCDTQPHKGLRSNNIMHVIMCPYSVWIQTLCRTRHQQGDSVIRVLG